jgi:tetratricopeptide (TPR) repeat protein
MKDRLSALATFFAVIALLLPVSSGSSAPVPDEDPAAASWRPFDLGPYTRPVSTRSAEAQRAFDQGLVWSYAFNHDEAERAFAEAARLDPGLAMAHWGIALVNGPHINNPGVDEAHAKKAWDALQRARALAGGASEAEKALIDALGSRYAWPQPADRGPLDAAYAKAMAKVRDTFPSDADVASLAAEALMDTRPWDQWTKDGKPQPGTSEVLEALERALKLSPSHPGALHLTIHALEASPRPERAAAAADRLRAQVPDSSHLVHMPSHIDVRLGRWKVAAEANERAIAADRRYQSRAAEIGFYRIYMAHNAHFLAYTAMMEGRRDVALATTREIVAGLSPEFVKANAAFADAFLTVVGEAQKRFGLWKEILAAKPPAEDLPVSTAHSHFLRGVAHAALGQVAEAEKERAALAAALPKVPKDYYWGSNAAIDVLAVSAPYLDGEIALRKGDRATAIAKLREAVRLEDALKYDEPPAWTVPSRHALGAILLDAERPAEAEAVYREDLEKYPENGWSLRGLASALEMRKKAAEAAKVEKRFEAAWARAEIELETSCLCVRKGRADVPSDTPTLSASAAQR